MGRGSRRYAILLSTFPKEFIIGFLRASSLPPFCCLSATKYEFIRRLNSVYHGPASIVSNYRYRIHSPPFRDSSFRLPAYHLKWRHVSAKISGPCTRFVSSSSYVRLLSRKLKYRPEARGTQSTGHRGDISTMLLLAFRPAHT